MGLTQEFLPLAVLWQLSELPAEHDAQPGCLAWDPLALAASLGQHPAELSSALPAASQVPLMRRMTEQKESQAEVRPAKDAMFPWLLHRLHSRCRKLFKWAGPACCNEVGQVCLGLWVFSSNANSTWTREAYPVCSVGVQQSAKTSARTGPASQL